MEEGRKLTPARHKRYRIVGLIVSLVYLLAVVGLSVRSGNSFSDLTPNEWGDFLAGCFGPLALFWLILGFWQQGDELRSSVEALMLQSEELRASVEQQRALVEVTKQQAEAELASLQEERQARRAAGSPHITVHAAGGYSTGDQALRRIRLTNLGANCSDLRLEYSLENIPPAFFSTLPTGEHVVVEWRFPGRDPPESFDMTMAYISVSGEEQVRSFTIYPRETRRFRIVELVETTATPDSGTH